MQNCLPTEVTIGREINEEKRIGNYSDGYDNQWVWSIFQVFEIFPTVSQRQRKIWGFVRYNANANDHENGCCVGVSCF